MYLCDVFAQRNINRTIAQQMARWPKAIEEAKAKGAKAAGIGISASWGSNWTGEVTQADRMTMLERQYRLWEEAGIPVTKVGISDPMGWNMPDQVERQIVAIKQRWPSIKSFNLHLHNTRGMALTSSYVCLKTLDATDTLLLQPAIGGMGGCPFCGNGRSAGLAPTEDLIHMLEGMGIETGVDLYKLIDVSGWRKRWWGIRSGTRFQSGLGRKAKNSTLWICPSSRLWSTPATSSKDLRHTKARPHRGKRQSRARSVPRP